MNEIDSEPKKRTDVISVLGILSFINCTIFILVYAIGLMGVGGLSSMPQEQLDEALAEAFSNFGDSMGEEQIDQAYAVIEIMKDSGVMMMGLLLLLTVGRLFGVIKMWRNQRQGFMIYAGSQLGRIVAPVVFFGSLGFSTLGAVLAIAMTAAYGSQLKHMA